MVEKERQLGNYYEMTGEKKKPTRPISLLKRTLTRGGRRTSTTDNHHYGPSPARPVGFLTRTFSLTKNPRRGGGDYLDGRRPALMRRHSMVEDRPPDESRLHPHWRPAHWFDDDSHSDSEEDEGYDEWDGGEEEEGPDGRHGRTYKYPPIDNRPSRSRRGQLPQRSLSLSQRMKRTFAILPARDRHDDDDYYLDGSDMPVPRRTIRRTPSGNLRVMKFRRSLESLPRGDPNDGRPYTAPEESYDNNRRAALTRFWRLSNVPAWMAPRNAGLTSDAAIRKDGAGAGGGGGNGAAVGGGGGGFLPTLGNKMNLTRRFSERRRQKRSQELRRMISGPREVRDGVGDVIRRNSYHR